MRSEKIKFGFEADEDDKKYKITVVRLPNDGHVRDPEIAYCAEYDPMKEYAQSLIDDRKVVYVEVLDANGLKMWTFQRSE